MSVYDAWYVRDLDIKKCLEAPVPAKRSPPRRAARCESVMRRLTAAVILVAMLGGCGTYRASRNTALVGGGLVVGGAALALGVLAANSNACESGNGSSLCGVAALTFYAGLPVLVGGVIGMAIYDKPPETPEAPAATPDPNRVRVLDLAKQARAAAYAHDCAGVKRREAEVLQLDPEFYATVFVRDLAIKKCLDAAGP